MTESTPFNDLLDAMPRITEAVNSFNSPEVQLRAFDFLVGTIGLPTPSAPTLIRLVEPPAAEIDPESADAAESKPTRTGRQTRRRASAPRKPVQLRDLNFRPEDKESLRDFVERKQPTTVHEHNLAAVYYLEQVLELTDITATDVVLVYKSCGWREPANMGQKLRATASEKKWISTADSKAITTMAQGRNTVHYDMPLKKDSKSA